MERECCDKLCRVSECPWPMAIASCGSLVGNANAVPTLTTSVPGGPCRRAVPVRLHSFSTRKFGGIGACRVDVREGVFSGKGGGARGRTGSGKDCGFHVTWCGFQVVSSGESEDQDAMASTRKLPKLQGTLFKYGSKSIQVAPMAFSLLLPLT